MSGRRQGVAQGKTETKRGCSQVRPGQVGGGRETQAIRSETDSTQECSAGSRRLRQCEMGLVSSRACSGSNLTHVR